MDTEIWSQADIRNGRIMLVLLFSMIVGVQVYTILALAAGSLPVLVFPSETELPLIDSLLSQVLATFAVYASLMFFVFRGHRWARLSLALLLLISAGVFIHRALPDLEDMSQDLLMFAAATGGIGLLGGLALLFSPPIRAYSWFRSTHRHTIPVPLDDDDGRTRRARRGRSLLQSLFSALGSVVTLLIVLAFLALATVFYGVPDILQQYF
jgi:hypothetical protein